MNKHYKIDECHLLNWLPMWYSCNESASLSCYHCTCRVTNIPPFQRSSDPKFLYTLDCDVLFFLAHNLKKNELFALKFLFIYGCVGSLLQHMDSLLLPRLTPVVASKGGVGASGCSGFFCC